MESMKPPTKNCMNCGKEYSKPGVTSRAMWARRRFCSQACHYASKNETRTCAHCGSTFTIHRHRKNRYCSTKCAGQSPARKVKNFRPDRKIAKPWLGKTFSAEHRANIRKRLREDPVVNEKMRAAARKLAGPKHWNWKGGITKGDRAKRQTVDYHEWRTRVYQRDRYCCRMCRVKCRSGNITAHHVLPFKTHPTVRYDLSNGLTLCRSCHKKWHEEIGEGTRFTRKAVA